ncbi:MAG: type IV secretion system protein VirB4, partial [Acetobacteraceae bacterium]
MLLEDGSVMAMLRIPGFPFELEDTAVRNARRRQLNTLLRSIADDNVTLGIHFVRHAREDRPHRSLPAGGFARQFFEAYEHNCLAGLWRNDWFLSVVVSPRLQAAGQVRARLADLPLIGPRLRRSTPAGDGLLSQIEDLSFIVLA